MAICIPDEFIDGVEKIIDDSKSSLERVAKLTDLFGNQKFAQEINLLYEKKLLLKDQETAINNFVDSINGIEAAKKQQIKEQISERLARRNEVIQQDELLSIVKDIYDRKYDLDITPQEAQVINKLKSEIDAVKTKAESTERGSPERLDWGRKQVRLAKFIDDVTNPSNKASLAGTLKLFLKESKQRFTKERGVLGNIAEGLKLTTDVLTTGILKSVQASADLSFMLRQGYKMFAENPKIWARQVAQSMAPIKNIKSKAQIEAVFDEFKARLVSDPMYQRAVDSKLAIGVLEEFFPTAVAEKFPVLGNIFKASNEAFSIFSQGSRFELFRNFVEGLESRGVKVTPEMSRQLAQQANQIVGRGSLGRLEAASGLLNKVAFSARFISSQLGTFFKAFDPKLTPEVRAIALKSTLKTLSLMGSTMLIASAFGEVGTDPRSSNFGKLRIGDSDVWVDLTGGLGSYITLAAKQITGETKSPITGKVTRLNTGKFGEQTRFDVGISFLTNKLAPAPSAGAQILKGKTYSGDKPTVGNISAGLVTPISPGNVYELFSNNDTATAIIGSVADILGSSETDYGLFR